MSATEFVVDLFTGNFSHAWLRLADFLLNTLHLPPFLVNLLGKALSAEGKILEGLVVVAAADLGKSPLTTDSIVTAAKDVYSQLAAQNISTFSLQYVFASLNAALDQNQTPSVLPSA